MLTWTWYDATPLPASVADQVRRRGAVSSTRTVPKWTVGALGVGASRSGPTETVRVPLSVSVPSLTTYVTVAGPVNAARGVKRTLPPTTLAMPSLALTLAETRLRASFSTSVSLASTSKSVGPELLRTLPVSSTATGASLRQVSLADSWPVTVSVPSVTS